MMSCPSKCGLFHDANRPIAGCLPEHWHTRVAQTLAIHTLRQPKGCNCGPTVDLSTAMVAIKLEHSNLAQHQASIFKQLQTFCKEGQLCDVVVKSRDGTEHAAHTAVLCVASVDLKNMLAGPFVEASRVQQGQPVELAASDTVVRAFLEYIYGDGPHVELENSFELLHLADAYNFPELAASIEAGLCASLDSAPLATALKVLQQTQHLHQLKSACEKKVATNFEMCIDLLDFLELSPGQVGRILRRRDLAVSREEVIVNGLFNWFNRSKDRWVHLGLLLQHLDFLALSSENLARLQHLAASMGSVGHDLQREVDEALLVHRQNRADSFWPKRHCLQHWSPGLGASVTTPQKVLRRCADSMCCHDGTIYFSAFDGVFRWKPGDTQSQFLASTRGITPDGFGPRMAVSVSPEGTMFMADCDNHTLQSYENGSGNVVSQYVVLRNVEIVSLFCSPSGAVYVLTQDGQAVEKLVGSTLQPVIASNNLPAELQFRASDLFVTQDEVIYLAGIDNGRIMRINPGEAEPVVVGEAPHKESSNLYGLFVTEEEKVYVADGRQRKVWALHPGDAAWTEVLTGPGNLKPIDVLVQGRSLYVSMWARDYEAGGVYEYLLPPKLQLG